MICCKDKKDYEIISSLRAHGWSRGLKNEKKIANQNKKLDKRFIFYNSGFNLRSTDISAAIGFSQFKDLDKFIKIRSLNRRNILKEFNNNNTIKKNFQILEENKNVKASWFGLPIMIKTKTKRQKIINSLEKSGIETRPIISGNFLKQPAIKKYKINSNKKFKNADYVNEKGFFIGLQTKIMKYNHLKKLVKAFEKSV